MHLAQGLRRVEQVLGLAIMVVREVDERFYHGFRVVFGQEVFVYGKRVVFAGGLGALFVDLGHGDHAFEEVDVADEDVGVRMACEKCRV